MGSALTTIGLDSIPDTNDAANVPSDFAMYANQIDHKLIHWAQDIAERDVLYAAAAAPIFVMSPGALWCKISGSGGGSVWVTIWGDSGSISSGVTPGTDFDTFLGNVRKIEEKFVIFSFSLTRRNSAIALNTYNHATSPGNIPGDPTLCTFPVGFRPDTSTVVGTWRSGTTDGAYRISTAGVLGLFSGNPNTVINTDEPVDVAGCFVAA